MPAARLSAYSSATLFEAAGGQGAMHSAIKPVWPGARLVGRARTVRVPRGDNLALHLILPDLRPGDVLVVDAGADLSVAIWGDVMTAAAQAAGAAGLVVDGAVRDSAAMAAAGFPVFSRAIAIPGPSKTSVGVTDVMVECGGVSVCQGDWVIGDADGVVVVAAASVEAVLAAAKARDQREAQMIKRLRAGLTTTIVELGLDAVLDARRSGSTST